MPANRRQAQAVGGLVTALVEKGVPSQPIPGQGFTAMVVDDHPLVRESMVSRLVAMGAREVVEAASVAEARARAHASGPRDLCILDLGLPDGSGLDLLADLRAAGWTRVELRPFLMPQRAALPAPVQKLLFALEPLPGAQLLTRVRFPLFVSAA